MELDDLYQDLLLDHFKNPRGKGCVHGADCAAEVHNPLCGDNIQLTMAVEPKKSPQGIVKEIAFTGSGCSISQASASMMTELAKGKSVEELERAATLFKKMMKEDLSEEELSGLGDVAALSGVRKFSARIRCAALAWDALDRCLKEIKQQKE